MTRREKIEIVADILMLCRVPTIKTRIVYQCNLNFYIIKRYLSWCFTNGWLQLNGNLYETTTLGKDYLEMITPTVNSLALIA